MKESKLYRLQIIGDGSVDDKITPTRSFQIKVKRAKLDINAHAQDFKFWEFLLGDRQWLRNRNTIGLVDRDNFLFQVVVGGRLVR